MAIKGLEELLTKFKNGEIKDTTEFEAELNKALAPDWTPKSVFNELNEKHKLTSSQLSDAQTQLETLKTKAGLSDEYKAQIEKMTSDHANAQADFEKQIANMKFDYALSSALSASKARDAKLVQTVLDKSKLSLKDDGSIDGLDEQLKAVKESHSYLFEAEDFPRPSFGGGPSNQNNPTPAGSLLESMRSMAGL